MPMDTTDTANRPAEAPAGIFETRHGPLGFTSRGSGPPLLLLPANGHDARDFDAVRAALCKTHETLAVDWPGTGASPALTRPEEARAVQLAEMVEDAVVGLGRRAVLIGHSVGGFAAARLAAREPAAVAGLVLVDAGGFAPPDAFGRWFCRMKGRVAVTAALEGAFARYHTKARNPHVEGMLRRIDAARAQPAYAATVAAVWRSFADPEHDLRAAAPRIECPTLVVWGSRDPVLPLGRDGAAVAERIPGARLVTLRTGHSPFVEDPEGFLDAVDPFLRALA